MTKLTVKDVDVKGKKVLMRVDFNVSIDKKTGRITDDTRIKAALPTIKYILDKGGSLILMSHLGRPKGEVVPQLKMDRVAERLSELLEKKVKKLDGCVGEEVEREVAHMKPGDVILLENTRFYREETENNPEFARKLAKLGNIYVNDAFGTAHRAHASTVGVAKYLPAVAGLLMAKELEMLGKLLQAPSTPFLSCLGGAKVSDKIGVLESLIKRCEEILIGGAMAYTFLRAQGIPTGRSLVEEERIEEARKILKMAEDKGCRIFLPVDHLVAPSPEEKDKKRHVKEIPSDFMALDIGPETVELFRNRIDKAKTVFWNGPMGYFEVDEFARGTEEIAKKLAEVAEKGVCVVVGGGDSIAALKKFNLQDKMTHVSTGGGASLEFLEGKELPGVAVLRERKEG